MKVSRNSTLFRYCRQSVIVRLALNGGRTIEVGKRQFAELEAFETGKLIPVIEAGAIDFEIEAINFVTQA